MTTAQEIAAAWQRLLGIDVEAVRARAGLPTIAEHLKILGIKNNEPCGNTARCKGGQSDEANERTVVNVTQKQKHANIKPTTPALPEKVSPMKKTDAFPSRFLKAADVNGEEITATISSVEQEEVGQDKTTKSVLYFRGKVKPLILNGTNWDAIVKTTGKEDSDEWEGKKITLYSTEVQFGGKMVDAIRVRAPKAAAKRGESVADMLDA